MEVNRMPHEDKWYGEWLVDIIFWLFLFIVPGLLIAHLIRPYVKDIIFAVIIAFLIIATIPLSELYIAWRRRKEL